MSENYDKYETIEDKNQETEEVGVIDEEALRFVFDFIKRNNFKAVIDEIVENYKKNSQLSISKDECKNIIATAGGQLVISGVIKNSTVKKDIKCWSISKGYRESSFENILDDVKKRCEDYLKYTKQYPNPYWMWHIVCALKELGGEGLIADVRNICKRLEGLDDEQNKDYFCLFRPTGANLFENQVAFSRNILKDKEYLKSSDKKPVTWQLKEKGKKLDTSDRDAFMKRINEKDDSGDDESGKKYWLFDPWSCGFELELDTNVQIVYFEVDGLDDLSKYNDATTLEQAVEKTSKLFGLEKKNFNKVILGLSRLSSVKKGHYLFVRRDKTIAACVVEDSYQYVDGKHFIKVNWINEGNCIDLKAKALKTRLRKGMLQEIIDGSDQKFLEEEFELTDIEISTPKKSAVYTERDFNDEVFMAEAEYRKLIELIKMKKNVILQGAPGVGKTFVAKKLAYLMMGEKNTDHIKMVQFHQSYSYEDFIAGYRPTEDGTGFEPTLGPFVKFCEVARDAYDVDKSSKYFFIIDEINRGNISKIFGELFMLIEKDKRGETLKILYKNDDFSVPPNVYIIGMMNTADRSLAMMDYALRRRFAFYELEPAFCRAKGRTGVGKDGKPSYKFVDNQAFKDYCKKLTKINPKFATLISCVQSLNAEIEMDLGRGFRIGHSYFVDESAKEMNSSQLEDWLKNIVEFELIPMLEEYWFDDIAKARHWANQLNGVLLNPEIDLEECGELDEVLVEALNQKDVNDEDDEDEGNDENDEDEINDEDEKDDEGAESE